MSRVQAGVKAYVRLRVEFRIQGVVVKIGDEVSVWGIGFKDSHLPQE